MDYKDLRDKLYGASTEEERVTAFGELDDLFDGLQKQLDDLRNANAVLFAKYGSPEEAVSVEEKEEVEEEPIDIKDIIFNDEKEGDEE